MVQAHEIRHASLVALRVGEFWRGALIEGPSGSGKSDLALRCLAAGFSLVADDRVVVFAHANALWGHAPRSLSGLIEARGAGILTVTPLDLSRISLCVELVTTPDGVERLPDRGSKDCLGLAVPVARLWPFETIAPAKLAAMLRRGNAPP